jgi:hypothetical protein
MENLIEESKKDKYLKLNSMLKGFDWLWLLIPIGIITLIILSILYVPAEKYDPNYDPRIENCGPGGTWC